MVQPSSAHCWADYFQTVRGCQAKDAETWKFKCSVEKMDNSKASPLHKRWWSSNNHHIFKTQSCCVKFLEYLLSYVIKVLGSFKSHHEICILYTEKYIFSTCNQQVLWNIKHSAKQNFSSRIIIFLPTLHKSSDRIYKKFQIPNYQALGHH